MKLHAALFLAAALLGSPFSVAAPNTLTADERAAGWQLLFDGKSLDEWRAYRETGLPASGWEVKDGLLRVVPKATGKGSKELITTRTFTDFEFAWEWRMSEGGNNGVKYFVTEQRPKAPGHEYQMIDDTRHPDGKLGPKRQTAAFYDVLAPVANKPLKPSGQWNASRIVVRGNRIEHWLNGANVLTYELGSAEVKAGLAQSKFKEFSDFGTKLTGHIMLTYHQDECWFRNLKVRELK